MHVSSYDAMSRFVATHLAGYADTGLEILDVGSQDVNGSYRALFDRPSWRYRGADMEAGRNVDIVLRDVYRWREIEPDSFDVVVSGQVLEHVEYPWMTVLEIARVLRPGGLVCVIVPSSGPEHLYPIDCWRVLADGARALARYAGLDVVEVNVFDAEADSAGEPNLWRDTVLVARKAVGAAPGRRLEFALRRGFARLSLPR
jgi:SAM-dependent methyltransferase